MTHAKLQIVTRSLVTGMFFFAALAYSQTPIFKTAQTYVVGTAPDSVTVGDFNGDGKPDLAVVNSGTPPDNNDGSISILSGNGDGTFQQAVNLTVVQHPAYLVAGDFNADGRDDLAVVVAVGSTVNLTVLLGNGDGTFQVRPAFGAFPPGGFPKMVAVDFNRDGNLDLAVASSNTLSLLLGNGDGTFKPQVDYVLPGGVGFLLAGDFNHDGMADLFYIPGSDSNLPSLLLGKGDGTFQNFQAVVTQSGYNATPAVGDFDHDGYLDLIAQGPTYRCGEFGSKQCPGPIGVFLGAGGGDFQGAGNVPFSSFAAFLLAADVDGDANVDAIASVAISGTPNSQIAVFPGNGDGTFQAPALFAPGSLVSVTALSAADLNGDNAPDLIALGTTDVSVTADAIAVLVNAGPDFTISASALSSSALSAGQSATSSVTLKVLKNFGSPVSLSCGVQPAKPGAPTCSLSSSSVTFDANGEASATLTIAAGSSVASLNSIQPSSRSSFVWLPVVVFALLGTGCGLGTFRRKCLFLLLISVVLLLGIVTQTSCGGGSGGPKSSAYIVTVTAASGVTQHSTAVNVTVK